MRDLGEYRTTFTRLLDNPGWRALPPYARVVFFYLKHRLPAFGIAAMPAAEAILAEDCGFPLATVEEAFKALVAAGWVEREGNVVWIVNGFRYDNTLNVADHKHRTFMHRRIASLPSLAIVARFIQHYAPWYREEGAVPPGLTPWLNGQPVNADVPITLEGLESPTEGPPVGHAKGQPSKGKGKGTKTGKGTGTETETRTTILKSGNGEHEKITANLNTSAARQKNPAVEVHSLNGNSRDPNKAGTGKATWLTPFIADWHAAYGGDPPIGQLGKALKSPLAEHGLPVVQQAWRAYLVSTKAAYASPAKFASTIGTHIGTTPQRGTRSAKTDMAFAQFRAAHARGDLTP